MIGRKPFPLLAGALLVALSVVSLLGAERADANDPLAKAEPALVLAVQDGKAATFWVYLSERADLSGAAGVRDRGVQGRLVYDRLTATAKRSQAGLRAMLEAKGVEYEPFWIANTLKVSGDSELLERIAARPEVTEITADRVYDLPEPIQGQAENTIQGIEWGIDRINAPGVWSQFGVRGEGIVVGAIDSGALFTHPALVEQYRGNRHDGSFDHNYNWQDPWNLCPGNPSLPCDADPYDERGTHVTGMMVGDDGGGNQIGVAPRAQWIVATACQSDCYQDAVLSAAQFMLAPTDLNGQNPRPELRPHIVHNSWSIFPDTNPLFRPIVQAWVAAGIWPQFGTRNPGNGSICGSVGNPGNLPESYAAGVFDINNTIASFSRRGPSAWGSDIIKPNIAAPGVNIRSSSKNGDYSVLTAPWAASAHVAGAVALLWSLSPALERDITATRTVLDKTAIDTSDLGCGGTAENNNVWGEGRLDVLAAANQAPLVPVGRLVGRVTDAGTGAPIAGVTVRAVGQTTRTLATDPNGNYNVPVLRVGSYELTFSRFGYPTQTRSATIAEGDTTTLDITLTPAPSHSLSGHVRDTRGQPIANATVTIAGTPIPPATTDNTGAYQFVSVPAGTYSATAAHGACYQAQTKQLLVSTPTTLGFTLPQRPDAYGYTCQLETAEFVQGDTALPFIGNGWTTIGLPWEFTFYGQTYTNVRVCADGTLEFTGPIERFPSTSECTSANSPIPSTDPPNGAIYPFWDDVHVEPDHAWRGELGTLPNRRFVIEWRDVLVLAGFGQPVRRVDFNVVLHENGEIETQYRNIASDDGRERGDSATLGIENADGTAGFQYSFNEPVLEPETSIRYLPPPPLYVQAVNAGGGAYTASGGEIWAADRAYTAGTFGYLPASARTVTTKQTIAGTSEPALYQSARRAQQEYRFDVPNGTYIVSFLFAEIQNAKAGNRCFDAFVEGELALFNFNIAQAAGGQNRAHDEYYRVRVTDGQLNVQFITRHGFREPLINAIKVSHLSGT